MAKKSAGVYIGRNYVDIVVATGTISKPALVDYASAEIKMPKDELLPPNIQADEKLKIGASEAFKLAFNRLKARPDEVFYALPETSIMVRHFNMPILPRSEQAQAIKFEAKKYIPFKTEEIFSDYKIISTNKENKIMNIFFVAAQKAEVESQVKCVEAAGIKLNNIDIAPLGMLRVLTLTGRVKKDETLAIVEFSKLENIVTINIIESSFPAVSRDIPIAQYKDTIVEKLISELRLSFDYYKRKPGSKEIRKIIIFGKDNTGELQKRFVEDLGIPCETIDPSKTISGISNDSIAANIAFGAALNGLTQDAQVVSLLPDYRRIKRVKMDKQPAFFIRISVAIILLTIFYSFIIVGSAKTRLANVSRDLGPLSPMTQSLPISKLEEIKTENTGLLGGLKALITEKVYVTLKLNRLASDLPDGVWIDSVKADYSGNSGLSLLVKGGVFTQDATLEMDLINTFLDTLKHDPIFMQGFDYCRLGIVNKQSSNAYDVINYSIECGKDNK